MFIVFVHTLLLASLAVWLYMSLMFIISVIIKRNDIADVAWGFGFVVAALTGLIINHNTALPALLTFSLVLIWGARLSLHIGLRNFKKAEDFRYRTWRETWGRSFYLRSYLQIYMLQGLLLLLIVSPALLITADAHGNINALISLTTLLWLYGFIFEAVGDNQLTKFLKNPKNKGHIMQSGLWRYTRHPNYFGEITQWWAIGFIALNFDYGLLALIGPAVITYLILRVSGVPLLEKKYANRPEYIAYKLKTSILIPLPTKNS